MASAPLKNAHASDNSALTVRERAFVAQYLVDLNGTGALRRLGLGAANPKQRASELLSRPRVRAAIAKALAEREQRLDVTAERIREEYAKLAFGKHEGPTLAGHKLQALEALAKERGMFRPEAAMVVPVVFQLFNGPPLQVDERRSTDAGRQRGDHNLHMLNTDA